MGRAPRRCTSGDPQGHRKAGGSAVPANPEDDVLPRRDAGARVLVVVPAPTRAAEDDGVVLADVVRIGGRVGGGAPRAGGGDVDRQHRPHVVVPGRVVVLVAGQPGGGGGRHVRAVGDDDGR